jgi:hypothetical protein
MDDKSAEELTKRYLPIISTRFDKSPSATDFTSYADGFLTGVCFAGGLDIEYEADATQEEENGINRG